MRIYYENRVGRSVEDPLGFARLIYHRGTRTKAEFQALLGHTTRLLARRGDGRLLVDQRLMTPFTPDEQQFVIHEWLPLTILEGGYRCGAVVLAHDVFARLATATVVTAVRDLPMTYRYFDNEAEAITWLVTT
ncbi:STAS/SEC14 domain-containing protein [Hymenobacter cavernae]|uniref:STAS/SEC14 domain-containing protein n=1 Tax=Hymenobacter cavernae TaxID=2044852 RepID=A0ABQ1TP40_9BACT|nr:STAS/SEC14 domain-containing protein [Hymenobacter cavernae]GGF00049.1 hypothetical protein GCM10011383_08670 [Hymenobacter cavernae]